MPPPVVAAADSELLERVYSGDREAEEILLARHRAAVEILPGRRPFFSAEASGRAALWWIPEPGRPLPPFRVVWLALRAQGSVPETPEEHAETWAAYLSLSPAQRVAVWHHEVEGQRPDEIARHLATTAQEAAAVLATAYDELGRLVSGRVGDLRSPLAEVVLGAQATDYLARRPRVARPPVSGAGPRRRPWAAVLAASSVAVAVAATVLMLANPGVSPAPDRGPVRAADPAPGTVLRPVEPSVRAAAEVAPGPAEVSGDEPGPAAPPAGSEPTPQPPPTDDPGPGPGQPPASGEDGPLAVRTTPDGATVVVDPGVSDPVVVEVPLPVVPALDPRRQVGGVPLDPRPGRSTTSSR